MVKMSRQNQMAVEKQPEIRWLKKPEEHDYPAALSFLCLVFDRKTSKKFVQKLRQAIAAR